MREKPVAFVITALVVGPLCALCILGPAALAALIAGLWGWSLGNVGLAAALALLTFGILAALLKRRADRDLSLQRKSEAEELSRHQVVSRGPQHE